MNFDDIFLFATVHFLRMTDANYAKAVQSIKELFPNIVFNQPKAIGVYSIGGNDLSGNLLSYWDWLSGLRSQKLQRVEISRVEPENLPAHISEAFANGVNKILTLHTSDEALFFCPVWTSSRSTALTGNELERLIDFQFSDSVLNQELWEEVLKKDVNRFGDYFEAQSIDDARRFLNQDFETNFCPATEILKSVQYFCARRKHEFKIPDDLQNKLEKRRPLKNDPFGFSDPYAPYVRGPLTATEIVELIDIQINNEQVWEKLKDQLVWLTETFGDESKINSEMTREEVRSTFLNISDEDLKMFPLGNITSALGPNFKIPGHLKSKFTYPEKPPIADDERWVASENPETWQMLLFKFLGTESASDQSPVEEINLNTLVDDFSENLKWAEEFSLRVSSPFAEAFRLAQWVLKIPSVNSLVIDAEKSGFSQIALNVLGKSISPQLYKTFELPDSHLRIALAVEAASVFGGMGSWNDQYFDSDEDNSEFEKISESLFRSLSNLQNVLISMP